MLKSGFLRCIIARIMGDFLYLPDFAKGMFGNGGQMSTRKIREMWKLLRISRWMMTLQKNERQKIDFFLHL